MTRAIAAAAVGVLRVLIRAYQLTLSPWVGMHCRYQPTCSHYALEAVERHGPVRGPWLAARRLVRCHPWGGSGYDPVPPRAGARPGASPALLPTDPAHGRNGAR